MSSEPESLVTATGGQGGERPNNASETRELKGLAKQWDENDRQAKNQAKRARRASSGPEPVVTASTSSSDTATATDSSTAASAAAAAAAPPQPQQHQQQQGRRFSEEEQKRRATYLQTGMKPGAVPVRHMEEEEYDLRPTPVPSQSVPPSNRNNEEEQHDEEDIKVVDFDEEEGQGQLSTHFLDAGPLVEAFVVPDEPAPMEFSKSQSALPVAQPTYVENPKIPPEERQGAALTQRNALLLIVALIGCFLVGAVLVVVLLLFVVNKGAAGSTNSFDAAVPTGIATNSVIPTSPPTFINATEPTTINPLPDLHNTQPPQPQEKPEDTIPTSAPTFTEQDIVSIATAAPSNSVSQETLAPSPYPTLAPIEVTTGTEAPIETTPSPTTLPPTTFPPTPSPTTSPPTAAPPTLRPTTRPTKEPTSRPTMEPTTRPTKETTAEPTDWPTLGPSMPTEETGEEISSVNANDGMIATPTPETTTETDDTYTFPRLDLSTTARVIFSVDYFWDSNTPDPSQQELNAIDRELMDHVTQAVTSIVDNIQNEKFLTSEHSSNNRGWSQSIWIDFIFQEGTLPSLNTLQSALSDFSVSSYIAAVHQLGPTFAETTRVEWGMSIPEYES